MAVEAMVSQGFAGEFVYIQIFQNEDGEEGKRRKDEKTKRRKDEKRRNTPWLYTIHPTNQGIHQGLCDSG